VEEGMSNGYDRFFKAAKAARHEDGKERLLRQALRMKRKKSRPPLPWKAVGGLLISLVLAGFYAANPDWIESLIGRIEVSAVGEADAEAAEPAAAGPAAEKANAEGEKAAAKAGEAAPDKGREPKAAVPEDLSHFEKLKQRKLELDMREKELTELEEELQKQKVELDKRIAQLEEMRGQIAQVLKDRVEVDQEKVNKLVDLYSNMKPKQAADVIGSINEDLAVEILAKMKKKSAAEIMNLLPPEKARMLSEKYTGYRRSMASQDSNRG
jgi:flagellar motility protein MotE (MotC chaperone)